MLMFANRKFEQRETAQTARPHAGQRLRAAAVLMLALTTGMPASWAQQTAVGTDKTVADLPAAPAPAATEPLYLQPTLNDYKLPHGRMWDNPLKKYQGMQAPKPSFYNSVRMSDLLKGGKLYLSLSDALALALENNYDIAIARYNLEIADTDILRSRAGASLRGVNSGVVANTLGSSSSSLASGGGPGGTSGGSGGAASGSSGLVLGTSGAGPAPASLDPTLSGSVVLDRAHTVSTSFYSGGTSTTNNYNFAYNQGFVSGTNLTTTFNNTYATTSNNVTFFSPLITSAFKATVTQHLLQGAGFWVNKRFMYQAINNRRITDASFRQQILYTMNQVENIYWVLVSAYEDVQAKQRALAQSSRLLDDNKKQLEIGSLAPLDVVNAQSSVATDQQALISSRSALNYQQQLIKQAIARNLNDDALMSAEVIPTDRVSLEELPEEGMPVESLVQAAFKRRPELEQAYLQVKNNEITLRGARNALLPVFDVYGYMSGTGIGGAVNPKCSTYYSTSVCARPAASYGSAVGDALSFNNQDKGVGFTLTIPLRNRAAQADQARSQLEYRQSELRLQQLYTQIRMQVVNAQFALTNDRGQVKAAQAAREYAQQSLDAEVKKLRLGASTTTSVLQQERALAVAENSLISAQGAYAKDRAGLYQMLASTLEHYGINLTDAAAGTIKAAPVTPGIEPIKK